MTNTNDKDMKGGKLKKKKQDHPGVQGTKYFKDNIFKQDLPSQNTF